MSKRKKEVPTDLLDSRHYPVVKSNAIIQRSRFELSLQEQKIVLRLIQLIKPDDEKFTMYEFKIKDFCEFCGIDHESGGNYSKLKKTFNKLMDKKLWVKDQDETGKERIYPLRWVDKPYIYPGSGTIKIKLDEDMRPYLLNLKANFTTYNLYYTLVMQSKYSVRMYELLKSYAHTNKPIEFSFDDLRDKMMAYKYKEWYDFKRKVIDIAVREINEQTDIYVGYAYKNRYGRPIDTVIFNIEMKPPEERAVACMIIENKLNSTQLRGQLSFNLLKVVQDENH